MSRVSYGMMSATLCPIFKSLRMSKVCTVESDGTFNCSAVQCHQAGPACCCNSDAPQHEAAAWLLCCHTTSRDEGLTIRQGRTSTRVRSSSTRTARLLCLLVRPCFRPCATTGTCCMFDPGHVLDLNCGSSSGQCGSKRVQAAAAS
jgi:hypothetical protein